VIRSPRSKGKADLVLRALVWLEEGHDSGKALASVRQTASQDHRRLALYLTLLHRVGQITRHAACRCLRQDWPRCRWALERHQPPQEEVTEWARLVHDALVVMEQQRRAATMRACRRPC
jgi:hypothetical protein